MEDLQSQFIHLQTQFTKANDNTNRAELLSNGRPSYWQSDKHLFDDDDDDDEPIVDYMSMNSSSQPQTVDDIRKQQNHILENQDDGLEALSKVISRQKHLALRIGDEFEEQNG